MGVGIISICHTDPYQKRFTLIWSKVKMSKDKNAEKINVENTGETFLALTLTHRSPPTPSFLFSTKVGFTI
jgi:hypothetical protein